MFVKPAKGRAIRHPHTMTLLRTEGEHVPETAYWLRAEAVKDIERAEPPAPADEEPPTVPPSPDAAAPAEAGHENEEAGE